VPQPEPAQLGRFLAMTLATRRGGKNTFCSASRGVLKRVGGSRPCDTSIFFYLQSRAPPGQARPGPDSWRVAQTVLSALTVEKAAVADPELAACGVQTRLGREPALRGLIKARSGGAQHARNASAASLTAEPATRAPRAPAHACRPRIPTVLW
jgi:hypothetical protein